ncbi:MAG: hypothetical protein H6835_01190 [Planctomycetes bacterium]|nr:hypothetical protein [Planctomycetota bacterium]
MDIKLKGGMPGMPSVPPQLPMLLLLLGAGAVGFGFLLLYNPNLLVYLVAGLFFLIGALLLITGWRAKRMLGG